ncbi:Replication initiation factor [Bacteroidales bacterium Barb6]|nr:Replication initiation factor [Bacteroidales bacterium Barb6]
MPSVLTNKLRIDFNPNHGMKSEAGRWLNAFIATLTNKHLTRCDIAFDIFNRPEVVGYRPWVFGSSKRPYYGRSGDLETLYVGQARSDKQIRQYNKLLEQKKKRSRLEKRLVSETSRLNAMKVDSPDVVLQQQALVAELEYAINDIKTDKYESWWRLELELHTRKISEWDSTVTEVLDAFYKPIWESATSPSLRAQLLVMGTPSMVDDYYASLNGKAREKLRKDMKKADKHTEIAEELKQVFADNKDKLQAQLHGYEAEFELIADDNKTPLEKEPYLSRVEHLMQIEKD